MGGEFEAKIKDDEEKAGFTFSDRERERVDGLRVA